MRVAVILILMAGMALGQARAPGDFYAGAGTGSATNPPYARGLTVYGTVNTNDVMIFLDRTGSKGRGTNLLEQLTAAGTNWQASVTAEALARAAGDAVAKTNLQAAIDAEAAARAAWAATGTVWAAERLGGTQSWTAVENGTNWLYTVTRGSNVVVTAVSGEGYNGPAVGTVFSDPVLWPEFGHWRFSPGEVLMFDNSNLFSYGYWFYMGMDWGSDLTIMPATLTSEIYPGLSFVIDWVLQTNRVRVVTEPTVIILVDAAKAELREEIPTADWKNEHYWYIDMEERPRVVLSTVTTTNDDAITYQDTAGIGMIDWQIIPTVLRGFPAPDFTYGVRGDAGTINQDGLLTMVSEGLVDVIVSNSTAKTAAVDLYYSSDGTTTVRPRVDRVAGSAGYAANTNIDSRISLGGDAYWLTNNPATGVFVRDPACWAAAADLSGVVVSTAGSTPAWHGTLLTTNQIIMAKHAYDGVGTVKRFVGRSGTNYMRTVAAILDPFPGDDWGAVKGDYVFARLNAGLPTNDVAVYPVFPASYTNQFPTAPTRIPALIYSQAQEVNVGEFTTSWQGVIAPSDTNRLAHYALPYSGDSGRPVFTWIGNQLVFAFVWTSAAVGWSSPAYHRATMDALLNADGGALTDADLSGYTEVWP
jgi:hypothetical protein